MRGIFFVSLLVFSTGCSGVSELNDTEIMTGAEQTERYLYMLKDKEIALVANQSSLIGRTHLVDTLLASGIRIKKIFSPEHGFRGNSEAGAGIQDGKDETTGIRIISLYGQSRKPPLSELEDIDLVLFDLQDVGTRFYTYISTLHYVMEACAEKGKTLIILDRPNPNGDYIDGPVLEDGFRSFVGMHEIPVLHGMTIGEYANMINGEGWLEGGIKCTLSVIACRNYDHGMKYSLPVPPSPNLPDYQAVRLYPSLCFFEGTVVSIGRGTDFPFQVYGHPDFDSTGFSFIPESRPGFSLHPKCEGIKCNGFDLREYPADPGQLSKLNLKWLISAYTDYPDKENFFIPYFDLLSGTDRLKEQITTGWTEEEIRGSWQDGIQKFREKRKKYLIYR